MDLLTFLGLTTIGPFLGNMLTNILSNRADSGLKQMESLLAAKLQDGQLPANHDLRQAVRDALRQALRGLALSLAANHHPASPFLQQLRRQLLNPQDRKLPVTSLLDVPFWTALDSAERAWIDAFAKLIENPEALNRLAGLGLATEGGVDALLAETPPAQAGQRLQQAVADWLDAELHTLPSRPLLLDDYLQTGWPLADGERRINLFQAWCWFFREAVKERPKVFQIYVAETLAEIKQQFAAARPVQPVSFWERLVMQIKGQQAPQAITLDDFGDYLTAEFADLKVWLESRFDRLDGQLKGIADTQAQHTGQLRAILAEIGIFPKLWRAHRWILYGVIGFPFLFLAILAFIAYQNYRLPEQTAVAVIQSFDATVVAARLNKEIKERFRRDRAAAVQAGKNWETIRELEKQRDMALAKIDDVIAIIEQGLAGQPNPVFVEASRILQMEGADAAISYLESHRAERHASIARDKAGADAAEEKLKQDAQVLFLEAELRRTRYEWEPALAALREAADIVPHWWKTRWLLGKLLRESAQYAEAQPNLQAAVALAEKNEDKASVLNELATLYQQQSQWAEAEPLYRQALVIDEKNLGPEHSEVAIDLNNLAMLLKETNRLLEAEPLMRRALAILEKNLGSEHPHVAIGFNNLAQLLQTTNRLAEAEPLMRQALAIDEKIYGPEHPKVAIDLNNLTGLLWATNRLAEAETLMRRALAIDEKSLGAVHPDVARDLNNLAQLLQDTNRLADAEPLLRRALAIDEKNLGPEHPNIARDLNNLAWLLKTTHRLTDAEPLMRRALAIDEKSYGPEHPDVARDLNNLAQLLQDTNRPAEAEPLMRQTLAIDEKNLGPEHPNVSTDLNNLALLLADTNRLSETEPLMRRALAIDEKSLGPEHPNVARDLNNLAIKILETTNRLGEAEPIQRRAVLILLKSTRAAGHELPGLRKAYGNYQALLTDQKLKPLAITQHLDSLGPEAGYTPEEWVALQAGWEQVRVAGVVPGSQAEGLGLQPGDVITRYAGEKITNNTRLIELTSQTKTPAIPLTILRAGKAITLTAQPGKLGVQLE